MSTDTSADRLAARVPLVHAQARQTLRLSLAMLVVAAAAVLAGRARWVPLHLFSSGALVLAISAVSQLLTVTWATAPAPADRWVAAQRWCLVAGVIGIVGGRERDAPDAVVGAAGAVYLLGLALLVGLLVVTVARAQKRRFDPAVAAYVVAVAFGIVAVGLGVRMAAEPTSVSLRSAHVAANLLGLIGLVVGGTLPYFAATVGRTRTSTRATRHVLFVHLAWQAATLATGAVALSIGASGGAALALAGYAAGIGVVATLLPRPTSRQVAWAGPRLVALWSGTTWWAVAVLAGAWSASQGEPLLGGRWLIVVVVAGYGQILWGSLAYLLPMLRGGGPDHLTRGFAVTRSWVGLAALNTAGLAYATGVPGVGPVALLVVLVDATWRTARIGTTPKARPGARTREPI